MQVVLVMFKSDGDRRSFSLPKDVTLVGRREDCDLRIPLSDVSRKHCRFIRDGQTLRVEDLGSSNGTFHNGVRVQDTVVRPGDRVQVGPVVFTVQIDGAPPDSDIQPPSPPVMASETSVPGAAENEPVNPDQFIRPGDSVTDNDLIEDIIDLGAQDPPPTGN